MSDCAVSFPYRTVCMLFKWVESVRHCLYVTCKTRCVHLSTASRPSVLKLTIRGVWLLDWPYRRVTACSDMVTEKTNLSPELFSSNILRNKNTHITASIKNIYECINHFGSSRQSIWIFGSEELFQLTSRNSGGLQNPWSWAPLHAVSHFDIYTWNINILHDCQVSAATLGADTHMHTLHVSY